MIYTNDYSLKRSSLEWTRTVAVVLQRRLMPPSLFHTPNAQPATQARFQRLPSRFCTIASNAVPEWLAARKIKTFQINVLIGSPKEGQPWKVSRPGMEYILAGVKWRPKGSLCWRQAAYSDPTSCSNCLESLLRHFQARQRLCRRTKHCR